MQAFEISIADDEIVCAAIHAGHQTRSELADCFAIGEPERLREEDPYTDIWARLLPSHIIGHLSRFEIDLNRPRNKAVYRTPDDAWGLDCWKSPLNKDVIAHSYKIYDQFYQLVHDRLSALIEVKHPVVVLDIHSYNHLRNGADAQPADWKKNPEVNIGTGTMDRQRWGPLVDRLMDDLRSFESSGRRLDVRENIKFRGGHFSRWIHQNFPAQICAPAIEFKKVFMDEWTGQPDQSQIDFISAALKSTFPGLREELQKIHKSDCIVDNNGATL